MAGETGVGEQGVPPCGVPGAGVGEGGVTCLYGQDALPPGPVTQRTQPPMSPGLSSLRPREGDGAAGTLPVRRASSGWDGALRPPPRSGSSGLEPAG